jgi:hypothetical protein
MPTSVEADLFTAAAIKRATVTWDIATWVQLNPSSGQKKGEIVLLF